MPSPSTARPSQGEPGQTILQAAALAGIYIPRLCAMKGLTPYGSCRVCTVLVNGRPQAACTSRSPRAWWSRTTPPELKDLRASLVEMLFVEGNHFCMFCEKSGNCELQAMAYRFGIAAPRYPYHVPRRARSTPPIPTSCSTATAASSARAASAPRGTWTASTSSTSSAAAPTSASPSTRPAALAGTNLAVTDKAAEACPVGCIVKKRVGFAVPIGQRLYDTKPIGTAIESGRAAKG